MGRAYEVRKASIQKTGAMKAKIYSTYAKEIYQAAKNGVPEIDSNISLKRIVDKAKKNQVPSDIIDRAIKKAKDNSHDNYETVYYEIIGPSGSNLIAKCLTDNVNRTISAIREVTNKTKTKMASLGSVSYSYDSLAVLVINSNKEEELFENILNHGIEIIEFENNNDEITISMNPTDYHKVKDAIEEIIPNVEYVVDEIGMYAKEKITLAGEEKERFNRLVDLLENVEDLSELYHNVEL